MIKLRHDPQCVVFSWGSQLYHVESKDWGGCLFAIQAQDLYKKAPNKPITLLLNSSKEK